MSRQWKIQADDGDHFRLAFDKPGTWSQKYNLVWDKVLDMVLFEKDIAEKEVKWYLSHQNKFGLPLDNRADYTKADWITWTATLSDSPEEFRHFMETMRAFTTSTTDRVPFSDWYDTRTARQTGFQARSVVGGIYMKMLADPGTWKKWRSWRPQEE